MTEHGDEINLSSPIRLFPAFPSPKEVVYCRPRQACWSAECRREMAAGTFPWYLAPLRLELAHCSHHGMEKLPGFLFSTREPQ